MNLREQNRYSADLVEHLLKGVSKSRARRQTLGSHYVFLNRWKLLTVYTVSAFSFTLTFLIVKYDMSTKCTLNSACGAYPT